MDHDAIIRDWQDNAELHDDENYQFLRSLKFRRYGFRPDTLAAKLHKQAFEIVQCTRCANCCKSMDILLTSEDVTRIAGHLNTTTDALIADYLEPDADEHGHYQVRQKPCAFLGDDDRCTIYEVRPAVCREFPHTDKRGFTTRTSLHARNALVCPAVFWIVEQMKQKALG